MIKISSFFRIKTRIPSQALFHSHYEMHKYGQHTFLVRIQQGHEMSIYSMIIPKIYSFSSTSRSGYIPKDDGYRYKRKISKESIILLQKQEIDDQLKNGEDLAASYLSYFKNGPNFYLSEKARYHISNFKIGLLKTWTDLLNSSQPSDINKKLEDIDRLNNSSVSNSKNDIDDHAADLYVGTAAIINIGNDNVDTFERMRKRLSEAPIIQDFFSQVEKIYRESGVKSAKDKLQDVKEDAKEAWETSQNPWVYRVSNVYDTITAENEFGTTERYLRDLDPQFSLESWKHNCVEIMLPKIMHLFLSGRIKDLKPHLGTALYNRLSAEARARKKEGKIVDNNVLDITHAEILTCTVDDKTISDGKGNNSPIIMLQFMCQQIHCVRNEDGKIVEGSEDDIRAYSYIAAFRRNYDEINGELNWKIVDFLLNGAIAYL